VEYKSMKILFLIDSLTGGGTEKVVSMLANDIATMGVDVDVVTFSYEDTDFFFLSDKVHRHQIGGLINSANMFSATAWNMRRVIRIRRAINKIQPTHIVTFLPHVNVLALLATIGKTYPVIVSERNLRTAVNLPWMWRWLRKRTYPRASAVTVNSSEMKVSLEEELRRPVQMMQNPLDLPGMGSCHTKREKLLISVGRLVVQKSYDLLINSFHNSRFQQAGWHLVVVGEGEERGHLEALVKTRGLQTQVSLPGAYRGVDEWYRRASLFILTSKYEGTPNAALEAMANQTPILITETCGEMRHIIQDKVNGLITSRAEKEVREKLDWAYDNQQLMVDIGEAGRDTVEKYGRQSVAKKWVDFLLQLN
jgi:GalNAc-alpha-(1->4)-GalNAc-alpha-(1->3)-diNAcBac-PP-undecaprenol alpha-1,4-N-acetyl-D-galactosaminyltransferase